MLHLTVLDACTAFQKPRRVSWTGSRAPLPSQPRESRNSFTPLAFFCPNLRTTVSFSAPVGSACLHLCPEVQRLCCLFMIHFPQTFKNFSPSRLLFKPRSSFSPPRSTEEGFTAFTGTDGELGLGFPLQGRAKTLGRGLAPHVLAVVIWQSLWN